MPPRLGGRVLVLCAIGWLLAACEASTPLPHATLELQIRNSGLPGGFVWVARADDPASFRWHAFGMAEYLCITCPTPFDGSTAGFLVAILDEQCVEHGVLRLAPGPNLVAVDLGPVVTATSPPTGGDWLPGDSPPLAVGAVPCSPPAARPPL
jgi:hypothetical protein